MNKKQSNLFAFSALSVCAIALATVCVSSTSKDSRVFAQYSPATSGTWVHYAQSLPGEAVGEPRGYGVREYWVECGGSYQFTAPTSGVIVDNGTNYDFSEFTNWDPRSIVPANAHADMFDSVLYDLTSGTATFTEVNNMKAGGFTAAAGTTFPEAGKTKKVLWLRNSATGPSFYADTLGATKVISNWSEYNAAFKATDGQCYAADDYLDGYYVLSADISCGSNINKGYADYISIEANDRGFSGVLDGRGHTFTHTSNATNFYNGGLFGAVTGATIKNINFANVRAGWAGFLSYTMHDSILKNVNIQVSTRTDTGFANGLIVYKNSKDNLFENITITADAGCNVRQLFGFVDYTNVFENVTYVGPKNNASELPWVAIIDNSNSLEQKTDYAIKGYSSIDSSEATYLPLDRQDIYVNSTSAISLSTGETNVGTVTDIEVTVGGHTTYSLGTNLSDLAISNELKAAPANHGDALVTITNSSGDKYALKATLVTEYIDSAEKLALIRGRNLNEKVYGYFALTTTLVNPFATIGATTESAWYYNDNDEYGFYGVLDGRGNKIRGNITAASNGIVSSLGADAVIKNLYVEDMNNTGWGNSSFVCGSSALKLDSTASVHPVKIYNVNISSTLLGTNGAFVGIIMKKYVRFTQFMNVTVDTPIGNGVDASGFTVTLFPANYFNASTRFNHLVWTIPAAVGTVQAISGINTVPFGITIVR